MNMYERLMRQFHTALCYEYYDIDENIRMNILLCEVAVMVHFSHLEIPPVAVQLITHRANINTSIICY
jgi:hypothetical protein